MMISLGREIGENVRVARKKRDTRIYIVLREGRKRRMMRREKGEKERGRGGGHVLGVVWEENIHEEKGTNPLGS